MMLNEMEYTVKLNRKDLCDLMAAADSFYFSASAEYRDRDNEIEVRTYALSRARRWKRIHDEVQKQIREQDKKHGFNW